MRSLRTATKSSPCSLQLEKACMQQRRHNAAKNKKKYKKKKNRGTSLALQWLRLHVSTAVGMGSIPGWGTKIPHVAQCGKKKKKKKKNWEHFA